MTTLTLSGGLTSGSSILPGTYTVDTLPVPSAANVDMYARVTDLFGEKRDLVLCSCVGSAYFWQPVRPTYARTAIADQNMTLVPLKSASVLYLTGSLSASRNLALSNTNAYPGASFEIAFDGALGLFGLNVTGLALGATLGLILGGRRRVFFDGDTQSWKQF